MDDFRNKVAIVTGGASGIGSALAERLVKEGAYVVLSDVNEAAAVARANELGCSAVAANVGSEADVADLVDKTLSWHGQIDLFVSNAGIAFDAGLETPLEKWHRIFDINVLAHVHAAKYALPSMLERGQGYFLNTASAAGILVEFDALPYTVTKHAAIGFAEWLEVTFRSRGIRVSVLVPAGVRTPMITNSPSLQKNAIGVDEVVEQVMRGLAAERFLISTHGFVDELLRLKGEDYETYMRRMEERRESYAAVAPRGSAHG